MCEHKQPYEMVGDKVCQFRLVIYHKGPFLIPEISETRCSHSELDISMLFAASNRGGNQALKFPFISLPKSGVPNLIKSFPSPELAPLESDSCTLFCLPREPGQLVQFVTVK